MEIILFARRNVTAQESLPPRGLYEHFGYRKVGIVTFRKVLLFEITSNAEEIEKGSNQGIGAIVDP
jgi:hypothetical protein